MSRKKKDEAAGTSKPFFARYLEGQDTEASSAKVGERGSLGYKKAPPPLQTRKFPSDSDELHYYPYYPTKDDVPKKPGGGVVTLKFPSDGDEDVYHASYTSKAAVPKGNVKAKGGTVTLKKATTIKAKR
ncbi:MAG TPA: microviridin/marinostatin family tricyclic proteinase inhibitor [Pyrinomonadaceae bacterium]|nr:microviridin/marinostatin family tricyclic proteinase inhibitor [Pyrinomonadaceae bacterium]